MPERRHGRAWRNGRPPWWPADEPFPPVDAEGREAWRGTRGRFVRRAGAFGVLVAAVFVAVITGVVWLVSGALTSLFGPTEAPGAVIALAVVLAVVGLLVVGRVVRRAAAPLGELVEASGRVEAGELGVSVAEEGPREFQSLARAFNAMSRRLADTDAERRRLLADVSHELRTPLAVIQGTVEGIVDGVYPATSEALTAILEEVRVMERLVEDLRTLSLADAGQLTLHREPTDLVALAQDVIAAFAAQAARAGVIVTATATDDVADLDVDPLRIRQVLANLVTNALRATDTGGRVTVAVAREPGGALVTVTDSGSGMAPDLAERAFERFSRAAGSTGSGLGLAIVRELVEAHGGTVSLRSAPGEGTVVRVMLPA
ncbi:MAG: HAMP domain-containing sensor histidine kinase [Chloroflexota bacterium]